MARLPSRKMTKSAVRLAREALQTGRKALPAYSRRNSPGNFTQSQLFAISAVRATSWPGQKREAHPRILVHNLLILLCLLVW